MATELIAGRDINTLPIAVQGAQDFVVGTKDGEAHRFKAPPSMEQFARNTGAELLGTASGDNVQQELNKRPAPVISSSPPNNADGRPDGTLYVQTFS